MHYPIPFDCSLLGGLWNWPTMVLSAGGVGCVLKGRVSLDVRAQSLRRALVERHPIGLTPGNFSWRDRRKLLARHGNRRALPPGLLPTPVVFGVTSRAAVGVSDIEDGLFVPIIVQGGHPVRPPVHDRMVASQVTAKLA